MNRLHRLLGSLGLLLASTIAVFAFLEAAPGGAAAAYRDGFVDRPFFVQYFVWLGHVLRGDFGWSASSSAPVSQTLAERLPATIELAFFGLLAATVFGAAIGFARARARSPLLSHAVALPQLVFRAIPIIVFAMVLQLLVAFTGVLSFGSVLAPVLCLAVPFGAWAASIFDGFFRASDDSFRTSLRSLAAPVAMTAASIGPALLAATVLIEMMFAWPGVARAFFHAIGSFDYAEVAGVLLVYSAGIVLIRLAAIFAPGAGDRAILHRARAPQSSANRPMRFSATGVVAFAVLIAAVLAAALADVIAPIGAYFIDQAHWIGYPLAPGVAGHVLGTDENGRDLVARVLVALRTSFFIAGVAAAIACAIGAAAARVPTLRRWFGGTGALGVIGIRSFAGFPFILAMVMVLAARAPQTVKTLSPLATALMIALVSWPAIVPAFRELPRTTLAAVAGLTGCALLLELTVSALGFGVQPPTPSLGNMLVNAQSNLTIAPWAAIVPSAAGIVALFALYALGDELRATDERA